MKLTKDDLEQIIVKERCHKLPRYIIINNLLKNQEEAESFRELMKLGYVKVKKDYLLKLQEDAEKYKKLYESVQRDRDSLMPDLEIVERLKKLLDTYKNEEWEEEHLRRMVVRELQEILGEENEGKEWDSKEVYKLIKMKERLKKRREELANEEKGQLDEELSKILGEKP